MTSDLGAGSQHVRIISTLQGPSRRALLHARQNCDVARIPAPNRHAAMPSTSGQEAGTHYLNLNTTTQRGAHTVVLKAFWVSAKTPWMHELSVNHPRILPDIGRPTPLYRSPRAVAVQALCGGSRTAPDTEGRNGKGLRLPRGSGPTVPSLRRGVPKI